MLRALRSPIGWTELVKRTAGEVLADNCLGLAAQLAYYFVLALFPALLFLVALVSFIPIVNLLDTIMAALARVAPGEALAIVQDQVLKIANGQDGGLLTLGMLGTIWSTSAGMTAIIDTLNQAYDIRESRPWWKVRLTAIRLTSSSPSSSWRPRCSSCRSGTHRQGRRLAAHRTCGGAGMEGR